MFPLKILFSFIIIMLTELILSDGAWAWGPGIHTVISCAILDRVNIILPAIASVIGAYPLEYIYGSLAADFFVGKGDKKREGHSHNWEVGFKFLGEAGDEREASYAYGFLSHLAADVVAHNYFVPDLIHRVFVWKRIGHFYSEAVADQFVGPLYIRIAKDVLSMEQLDCDRMLKSAVQKGRLGLKTRRHIYTQSVRISDFLYFFPGISASGRSSRYQISPGHLDFMIELSYRLVKDLLSYPDSSPCLSHDPIGSENLRLASKKGVLSKFLKGRQPFCRFPVDRELLEL